MLSKFKVLSKCCQHDVPEVENSCKIKVFALLVKEGVECTEAEIQEFCLGLPRYKRPRKVIFDKIPRNPTGKIEKPVLRDKYCKGRLVEAQITG